MVNPSQGARRRDQVRHPHRPAEYLHRRPTPPLDLRGHPRLAEIGRNWQIGRPNPFDTKESGTGNFDKFHAIYSEAIIRREARGVGRTARHYASLTTGERLAQPAPLVRPSRGTRDAPASPCGLPLSKALARASANR